MDKATKRFSVPVLSIEQKRAEMYRNHRCLFRLLLLWATGSLFAGVVIDAKKPTADADSEDDVQEKYLYHTDEAKGIIIDYEPPPIASPSKTKDGAIKEDPDLYRPDFIYGPNQGPRVVEFYAPWCPHVCLTVWLLLLLLFFGLSYTCYTLLIDFCCSFFISFHC